MEHVERPTFNPNPIVAPIHLVQSRGGPLGAPRGGVWGMNTSTTPHTPLETLLLFRGVAQHGLDDADFARISEALQRNGLVKAAPTYDARRLHPDTLRDLFLRLVREELRTESQDTPGPDGALSPASKKRRLQSPPLLTLSDARQHVEKIEAAHLKLHDAYLRHAVAEIRQFERQYEFLAREIEELEKSGVRDPETEPKLKPQSSNGAQEAAGKLEAGPANGVGPSAGASPKPSQTPTPRPVPNAARPLQPLQPLMPHAAAQQDARNGPQRPQPPNLQAPPYRQQAVPQAVPSPVPANPDAAQRYSSPYQPPRPAAVERIHPRQPATATPTPASRFSPAPLPPQTPAMTLPPRLAAGSGTKWASTSTPSTPKPGVERRLGYDDVPSPAFEPTSPVLLPSAAKEMPRREGPMETPKPKPNRPQVPQRAQGGVPAPSAPQLAAKQVSQPAEPDLARIKQEAATPRPSTETGDTTADESVTGRPQPARSTKRKLCGSAMEQIVHHRSANMFAAPIREKDAPGYQSIINSSQLDRELAHMFSNAIMYNPDPHHGPGPAFVKDTEEDDATAATASITADSGVLGYKVDEFGVVNDARAMFAEVEKLLSELRSREVRRNVPPGGTVGGGAVTGTSTRQASVLGTTGGAGGGESVKDDGGEDNNADGEEEQGEGTVKRRRVGRG
ncbi:hypothetical protein NEMBOFW57_004620 [Staphylotrichum longicolle]|uniref:Bromo domain-containing protein n=1 Tax=Staphylotrichum longicolle TaxID=669026 RepID=A0AAD4F8E2_9PEZI|nr:hypothetical protein NEMBOFW57_004620 [Staphylotrichum longicolle]